MPKIRIVALSDTHGEHWKVQVPDGDVLIHAGDFMRGGMDPVEIVDFARWMSAKPHPVKLLVAGNHDLFLERSSGFARSLLTDMVYLENRGYEAYGLKFWGSPYTPEFNGWAFMAERGAAIQRHWDLIPESVDVLITHGPAYGRRDIYEGASCGCRDLGATIAQRQIPVHLFGHIHSGYGVEQTPTTTFYNVAVLDPDGRPTQPVTVLDLDVPEEKLGLARPPGRWNG